MSLKRKILHDMDDDNNINGDVDLFKNDVNKFTDIDNKIRELTERIKPLTVEIKELKKDKTEIKKDICSFMEKNNLDKCALRDKSSTLIYRKRRTMIPITQSVIKDELKRYFVRCNPREFNSLNAEEKAAKIYDFIYSEREYRFTDILQNKINK